MSTETILRARIQVEIQDVTEKIRAFYSAPRGEGDADFKIRGPATEKNYGNATAAPPEPGRNFGPAFGGHTTQNRTRLSSRNKIF